MSFEVLDEPTRDDVIASTEPTLEEVIAAEAILRAKSSESLNSDRSTGLVKCGVPGEIERCA